MTPTRGLDSMPSTHLFVLTHAVSVETVSTPEEAALLMESNPAGEMPLARKASFTSVSLSIPEMLTSLDSQPESTGNAIAIINGVLDRLSICFLIQGLQNRTQ